MTVRIKCFSLILVIIKDCTSISFFFHFIDLNPFFCLYLVLCFQGIYCLMTASISAYPTKTLKNLGDEGRFISAESIRNDKHKTIKEKLLLVYFDWQNHDADAGEKETITENSLLFSSRNSLVFDDHYSFIPPDGCCCRTTNLCYGDFIRLTPCSNINNQEMMLHVLHSQLPLFTPGMKNYIIRTTFDIFLFLYHTEIFPKHNWLVDGRNGPNFFNDHNKEWSRMIQSLPSLGKWGVVALPKQLHLEAFTHSTAFENEAETAEYEYGSLNYISNTTRNESKSNLLV